MFDWKNCYVGVLNMDHRTDRLTHFYNELPKLGLSANRHRGRKPEEFDLSDPKLDVMRKRTPGAIGCHYGQVDIMKMADELGKDVMVFEDDVVFCSDMQLRLNYIQEFLNQNEWDIFWLGGTFHVGPPHWYNGKNSDMISSYSPHFIWESVGINRDAECTYDPRIMRTYGAFSTHAYIVNKNSLEKILKLLEEYVHLSMGIDWIMIQLQPMLKTYAFVPGCVKQIDNMSDIGHGMTVYSGFSRLNGTEENSRYWWQDKMEDFDPSTFNWQEASLK